MRVIESRRACARDFEKGDKFVCDAVRIGPLLGAKDLGYSSDIVPPGKRSCPFHSHRGEEEMFFIVRGEGTLRYGSEIGASGGGMRHMTRADAGVDYWSDEA